MIVLPARFGRIFFVFVLAFLQCKGDVSLPSAPGPSQQPPVAKTGGIGGYIFGVTDGNCLVGARAEIVDGSRAGEAVQQRDCPFGDDYGYFFQGLPVDTMVTIRASAPGYRAAEVRMYPTPMTGQTNFVLSKE